MSAYPSDPAGDLAAAEAARQRLTGSLRLPSWFHTSLGVAVAVQIWTVAYALEDQSPGRMLVLVAGCAVFAAVAVVQTVRFRRLNGVRVSGWVSRAVYGTSVRSSLVEGAALVAAVWAAFAGSPWLSAVAAALGGVGYAVSAHLWWRAYRADPAGHARAGSRTTLVTVLVVGVAFAGFAVLVSAA